MDISIIIKKRTDFTIPIRDFFVKPILMFFLFILFYPLSLLDKIKIRKKTKPNSNKFVLPLEEIIFENKNLMITEVLLAVDDIPKTINIFNWDDFPAFKLITNPDISNIQSMYFKFSQRLQDKLILIAYNDKTFNLDTLYVLDLISLDFQKISDIECFYITSSKSVDNRIVLEGELNSTRYEAIITCT